MNDFSYIGRKPCGCLVAAVIDDPDHASDVSKAVSSWIKRGLTIERVTHDVVRTEFTSRCPHEVKQTRKPKQLGLFEGEET